MPTWKTVPDSRIAEILARRIDREGQGVGIAVGIVEAAGRRTVVHGVRDLVARHAVTAGTLFEIGSITKVYTSLLLADMAARGECGLDEALGALLPAALMLPWRGRPIVLRDLASHGAGLPSIDAQVANADPRDPYAGYGTRRLFDALARIEPRDEPGTAYAYSNLGAALLGQALALRAGLPYEELVARRILRPLGLERTAFSATPPALRADLATGHDAARQPVPHWNFEAFAPAGALRSCVEDQLAFLAAHLGFMSSPLDEAVRAMRLPRRPTGTDGLEVALGWHVLRDAEGEIFWHNGGTGGFRGFAGIDPARGVGVVVLSNLSSPIGVDDLGLHLLRPASRLRPAPNPRVEVAGDPARYDGFAGRYRIAPGFEIAVRRDGERLFGQATQQSAFELFAEGERAFFLKEVDARIVFDCDAAGRAVALTLHQGGHAMTGPRVGDGS